MSIHVHTFPVPEGWSPEQAWEAHSRGERLPTMDLLNADASMDGLIDDDRIRWVTLWIEGGSCVGQFWRGGRLVKWEDQ